MPENSSSVFTQSPASTAFSSLYTRALNYILGYSTDAQYLAVAKEGINEGIERLNTRNWTWALMAAETNTVAGTQEYALNSAFKAPRMLQLLNATSNGEVTGTLDWIDPKEIDVFYPDRSVAGTPTSYTIYNEFFQGQLCLNVRPTSPWVTQYPRIRARYYRRTAFLSADADLLAAPTECEPFITWLARATLAAHWAPEKAAFAEMRAEKLWAALVRDDVRKTLGDF